MSVLTFKCPNCAAPLTYQPGSEKAKCGFCMSQFTLLELEQYNAEQEAKAAQKEAASGQKTAPSAENTDSSGATDNATDFNGYICDSCGAEVVTDGTTATTYCYYCHNPVILKNRISGVLKPKKIIPFAIDRTEAEKLLLAWARKRRFVPRSFFSRAQIEKMTGMYIPYWLAEVESTAEISGRAYKSRTWTNGQTEYTERKVFAIERHGSIGLQNVAQLALKKIDSSMIDSISPYNFEELRDFGVAYLPGFFAETYDLTKEEVRPEVDRKIADYNQSLVRETVSAYDSVDWDQFKIDAEVKDWSYTLLPAWVMTYYYAGKQYIYAMNGQSGELYGELPIDKPRLLGWSLGVGLIVLLLMMLGGYFIW